MMTMMTPERDAQMPSFSRFELQPALTLFGVLIGLAGAAFPSRATVPTVLTVYSDYV